MFSQAYESTEMDWPEPVSKIIRNIGIDWAIPVDPVALIAHLKVHTETKEIQQALRICHRYGKGPAAYIAKLPSELLDMIIESVLQPLRVRASRDLSRSYRCFQNICSLREHFDPRFIAEIREEMEETVEGVSDGDLNEVLWEDEHFPETHAERSHRWETQFMWGKPVCSTRLEFGRRDFDKIEQVIESSFRLALIPHANHQHRAFDLISG